MSRELARAGRLPSAAASGHQFINANPWDGDTDLRRTRIPRSESGRPGGAYVPDYANSAAAEPGLPEHLGALDFEGRSFPGCHHHMPMTSAYACRILYGEGDVLLAVPPTPPVALTRTECDRGPDG
jgi:hypothetical protein